MTALLDHPATHGLMGELAALREDPGHAHLTDEMLATVGVTLFGAGVVSTSGFLTTALVHLLTHLIARDLLRDRPSRPDRPGLEELLRVNLSIGDALPRLALTDVRLGDAAVRTVRPRPGTPGGGAGEGLRRRRGTSPGSAPPDSRAAAAPTPRRRGPAAPAARPDARSARHPARSTAPRPPRR